MNHVHIERVDSPMRPLHKNTKEILLYILFGGMTTLVNIISFYCFDLIFPNQGFRTSLFGIILDPFDAVNITVSWTLAVLFAYITNRIFVFRSKGPVMKELIGFFASRVATLIVFEIGFFYMGILIIENLLGHDKEDIAFTFYHFSGKYKLMVKLAVAVFVVVGNYALSKVFVFNKKQKAKTLPSAGAADPADPVADLSAPVADLSDSDTDSDAPATNEERENQRGK